MGWEPASSFFPASGLSPPPTPRASQKIQPSFRRGKNGKMKVEVGGADCVFFLGNMSPHNFLIFLSAEFPYQPCLLLVMLFIFVEKLVMYFHFLTSISTKSEA